MRETITRTEQLDGELSHEDAIASVESALRERYDLADIKSVDARRTGVGNWSVCVEGIVVEVREGWE